MFFRPTQIIGVLDFPRGNQVVKGRIQMSGWVLASSSEKTVVELYLGDKKIPGAVHFNDRPDVLQIHPSFAYKYNQTIPGTGQTPESIINVTVHLVRGLSEKMVSAGGVYPLRTPFFRVLTPFRWGN